MRSSAVLLLWCITAQGAERLFVRGTYVMGTIATVKVYAADESLANRWAAAAFAELRRLDDIFTSYCDSELIRVNRDASTGAVKLSDDMFELVRISVECAQKFEGTFDPTVGPAVRAWGFFGGGFRVPDAAERAGMCARTGWERLDLDAEGRTLRFRRPGMELDVGGIAKGYAAEKAARAMAAAGAERGIVNLGESSLFALARPQGRCGWPVRILDPRPPHRSLQELDLPEFTALSTSGTYGRFFQAGGVTYTHILDPRTLEPLHTWVSATVLSPSGAESDAAAKAVILLPEERRTQLHGLRWLRLEDRDGSLAREEHQLRAK